jgi:hypothetical protein
MISIKKKRSIDTMKKMLFCLSVWGIILFISSLKVGATPVIYTSEADYLDALAGYNTIFESFEGSAWSSTRDVGTGETITNLGITWDSSSVLATSTGFARTGYYGVYSSYGTYDDLIIESSTGGNLYGAGGWLKASGGTRYPYIIIGGSSVGSITIYSSSPHTFFGVIDTEGFSSVTFRAGDHFGADDFTIATPVPNPTAILLFGSGLLSLAGLRRKNNKP